MTARRLRDESGQSLVEFAVILPLVVAVILALVDFGRAFYMYLEAEHAASDGARLAAVNFTPPGGGTLAAYLQQNLLSGELKDGSGSTSGAQGAGKVCVSFPNGGATTRSNPVRVDVTNTFRWVPGGVIPGSITITGTATMRLEQNSSLTGQQCSS
jgi:Flp pilus assembly protein TadG